MTLREGYSRSDPAEDRDLDAAAGDDLAEAERLISDLIALLDAGVVEVREQVLGPARYGVAPARASRPAVRATRKPRISHSPAFSDERRPGVSAGSPP